MNILEQLNLSKKHPRTITHVTTLGDVAIGEKIEFVSREALKIGEMVYLCNPAPFPYGRAIITDNPFPDLYKAKRTS